MAILTADDSLLLTAPAGKMFLAELGLDGRLARCPGCCLVSGVHVVGASTLTEMIMWLRGGPTVGQEPRAAAHALHGQGGLLGHAARWRIADGMLEIEPVKPPRYWAGTKIPG